MKIMFEKQQLTDGIDEVVIGLIRNKKQTNEAYKRISASYKSVNKSAKTTDEVSIETLKRDPRGFNFSTRI